nr:hypothetical protein [Tanacetum cinerariifolium]
MISVELKKIIALLAKAFNRRKFYSKPTNNNLRTSSSSQSANKKQEFVKTDTNKVEKKDDEKKRDMSRVKCYNCKKEGHFAKDCKKAKASSSSADEKISEVSYYLSEFKSESKFETLEYYDNSTNYGLFVNNDDDQEIFHDAIESASENFIKNHIDSQKDYDKSDVDPNDSKEKNIKDFENQNKDLQDKYDVLKNQTTTFEMNNKELNEQMKELIENNNDFLAQTNVLKVQLQVKHVVINTHVECQGYDYGNLNASYVNEKINLEDDYFQQIINPDFEKIDSPFQETSSLKPYVPNVILKKIIIDLEDEVVNLLEKEKLNLETIESLKSKSFESSEKVCSESENQSENDCLVIEKECDKEDNPKVIAPGIFKLNVLQCVSPISMSQSSCDSNNVEINLKRKRHLDTFSSVRRPRHRDVIWKKKWSSNTSNVVASNSSTCLLAKASSQSWLWHQRLSHLNFATINNLVKNNLVQGLPKMKFEKDHLCYACEQGKIHRKHYKSKTAFDSNKPLYILHMDLCGPMRVQSINGKRYVLVIVDDYSRYTWVFFLHSKDEAFEVIISFIKKTQVNLQLQVQRVRTDHGTKIKNKTLAKFFDENCLIIHKRFDKTPYELINKRKPNIKFFLVFGCRCYLLSDYEDVGKLKAKGDIGVFLGLPKMKVEKDHLCSACEQGKIHRKHLKSKMDFASNKPLYLLHMDLCGPMRVQSINGKRYVLVVVDNYSRYTWVFFLHSKDEASDVIISFIKKTQVNLQLQVQRVRTDNGTEFKNKTLAKFFDETNFMEKFLRTVRFGNNDFAVIGGYGDVVIENPSESSIQVQRVQTDNGIEFKNKTLDKFFDEVGITQQFFAARTPQQNGVVERRNRTLVEAARTMLTFANLPSFLWAEAIATDCSHKMV